jgi:Domain of unknown function (DUF4145)
MPHRRANPPPRSKEFHDGLNQRFPKETSESRERYKILGEPELITSTFCAWLKCSNDECGEEAVVVGNGKVVECEKDSDDLLDEYLAEQEEGIEPGPKYRTIYQPLFCFPMPDMFELSQKCPDAVKAELRGGFRLFWSDQAAAANHVRIALERLMDHLRIPKRRRNKKGKFFRLKLHCRINEELRKTRSAVADQLLPLKWLGNTGSHEGSVSREDILDGFEILEDVFAQLFDKRTVRLGKLARQIIKKHAPRQS